MFQVFDRRGNEWVSLGKVCGRNFPVPFNTTGPRMKVVFHSDESVSNEGFKVRFVLMGALGRGGALKTLQYNINTLNHLKRKEEINSWRVERTLQPMKVP